ncbi:hypothetical protein IJT17_06455 [bacterium]|nr:hypothetical protein [bacterium]
MDHTAANYTSSQSNWPSYIIRGRRRFPRAWQPWTSDEDRLLITLYSQLLSLDDISRTLGRGINGVRWRLQRLGILTRRVPGDDEADLDCGTVPRPQAVFHPCRCLAVGDAPGLDKAAQEMGADRLVLDRAVQSLDQLHWLVWMLRRGWSGGKPCSLGDIAERLGRSAEFVKRVYHEAEDIVRAGLAYYGSRSNAAKP